MKAGHRYAASNSRDGCAGSCHFLYGRQNSVGKWSGRSGLADIEHGGGMIFVTFIGSAFIGERDIIHRRVIQLRAVTVDIESEQLRFDLAGG